MALRNTIWIKALYEKYWDAKLIKHGIKEILPEVLFNFGYADINFEHINNLTELSISAGISKPLQSKINVENNSKLNE